MDRPEELVSIEGCLERAKGLSGRSCEWRSTKSGNAYMGKRIVQEVKTEDNDIIITFVDDPLSLRVGCDSAEWQTKGDGTIVLMSGNFAGEFIFHP